MSVVRIIQLKLVSTSLKEVENLTPQFQFQSHMQYLSYQVIKYIMKSMKVIYSQSPK